MVLDGKTVKTVDGREIDVFVDTVDGVCIGVRDPTMNEGKGGHNPLIKFGPKTIKQIEDAVAECRRLLGWNNQS